MQIPRRKLRKAQRKLAWRRAHRDRTAEALAKVLGISVEHVDLWPRKTTTKRSSRLDYSNSDIEM